MERFITEFTAVIVSVPLFFLTVIFFRTDGQRIPVKFYPEVIPGHAWGSYLHIIAVRSFTDVHCRDGGIGIGKIKISPIEQIPVKEVVKKSGEKAVMVSISFYECHNILFKWLKINFYWKKINLCANGFFGFVRMTN
jgi:hypothetical protein